MKKKKKKGEQFFASLIVTSRRMHLQIGPNQEPLADPTPPIATLNSEGQAGREAMGTSVVQSAQPNADEGQKEQQL